MLKTILSFLTGGALEKAFSLADKYVQSKTDQEAIKADLIKSYYSTRSDWMNSGGRWIVYAFAFPLAFYYASVVLYSVFLCSRCAYPQKWTVAALPAPLDEWSWMIVVSIFGVIGVTNTFKRK